MATQSNLYPATVLAETANYLVEYEAGTLHIVRYSDGGFIALKGRGIAGQFRDCLKTHHADRVVATFVRMAKAEWLPPCYKKGRIPRPVSSPTD